MKNISSNKNQESQINTENLIGWSKQCDNARIRAKENQKRWKPVVIFVFIVVFSFLIFAVISRFILETLILPHEWIYIISGIAVMILLSATQAKTWDGVVSDKTKNISESGKFGDKKIYTVVITDSKGKSHFLRKNNKELYDYFNIGDKVRYHKIFGTYEKYDKSKDNIIYCNVCGACNDINNEICSSCSLPLFK